MYGSYNLQLEKGFTGQFEIPVNQMSERGAEEIQLWKDSGIFILGEGSIDETSGTIEQVISQGPSDEQVGGYHGMPWRQQRP